MTIFVIFPKFVKKIFSRNHILIMNLINIWILIYKKGSNSINQSFYMLFLRNDFSRIFTKELEIKALVFRMELVRFGTLLISNDHVGVNLRLNFENFKSVTWIYFLKPLTGIEIRTLFPSPDQKYFFLTSALALYQVR